MTKKALAFGEIIFDHNLTTKQRSLGGAPANGGFGLAHLGRGNGISVKIVSSVGNDPAGKEALLTLDNDKIDVTLIQIHPTLPTGAVNVFPHASGIGEEYEILKVRAFDQIVYTQELRAAARACDALMYGSLITRCAESSETLRAVIESLPTGAIRLCDLNLRRDCYSREQIDFCLTHTTVLKLNDLEVKALGSLYNLPAIPAAFSDSLLARFPGMKQVMVTLGAHGIYGRSRSEECLVKGFHLKDGELADTIGSGDAATAGILYKMLKNDSFTETVAFANGCGAYAATQFGGMVRMTPAIINSFIQSRS